MRLAGPALALADPHRDISQYQKDHGRCSVRPAQPRHDTAGPVPANVFEAIARGEVLPIIFFSAMFGLGLSALPAHHRDPLVQTFRSIAETMFKVTNIVMRHAPVGVFALIAVTVSTFGFFSLPASSAASTWPAPRSTSSATRWRRW